MLRERLAARAATSPRTLRLGRVTRVVGLVIEAVGLDVGLSELCRVTSLSEEKSVLAEVVGFHERGVLLMPLGDIDGLHPGSGVTPLGRTLPDTEMATLIEPDGPNATAYLLTQNYRAILDYNCSNFYALSVGVLADAIARR